MIVVGGIIGSGIFMTPSLVAKEAGTPALMIAAWSIGGAVALLGACVFAELAWRRPDVQGMYGYLRDALHPAVAFTAGWSGLLVSMTGGIAASAMAFATYAAPLTHWNVPPKGSAVAAILILSAINCLGVREGGTAQNILTLLKGAAIVAIIIAGFVAPPVSVHAALAHTPSGSLLAMLGAALVPVFFAYDGWQTAPYLDRELKDPARSLPRAIVWGVVAVALLYILIAIAGWRMLGMAGLAASQAPAAQMFKAVAGDAGVRFVSVAIAVSTLGFMSNSILASPRLYYAMARDRVFFRQLADLHQRTRTPIVGIIVQALVAVAITLSGRYDQILAYVVAIDFLYFAAVGVALFVFRRRDAGSAPRGMIVPGHPWTTAVFVAVSLGIIGQTYLSEPRPTLIGLLILASGIPVYFIWRRASLRSTAVLESS